MKDLYYKNKISCLDLLSLISEERFDIETSERLIKNYENMFLGKSTELDEIFYAIKELCIHIKIDSLYQNTKKEKDLYPVFDKNIGYIFDNSVSIIEIKNHPDHIPDRWIQFKNYNIPIEFKLHSFNIAAKRQLRRYIDFYKCKLGIAIGDKLTTNLDDDMLFINIKDLDKEKVILDRTTLEKRIGGGIRAAKTKEIASLKGSDSNE